MHVGNILANCFQSLNKHTELKILVLWLFMQLHKIKSQNVYSLNLFSTLHADGSYMRFLKYGGLNCWFPFLKEYSYSS